MMRRTTNKALALCLAGTLVLQVVWAAGLPAAGPDAATPGPLSPPSSLAGRRLLGTVLSDSAAKVSSGGADGSSSSASSSGKALTSANSKNAAGVSAAASNNWDFDKEAPMTAPAAKPAKEAAGPTSRGVQLTTAAMDEFPESAYPSGGRRRLRFSA